MIKSNASIITSIPLIMLLIAVYSVSNLALRENMDEFKNSLNQIKNTDEIQ
jgi:preprotein translocase subunit YajC